MAVDRSAPAGLFARLLGPRWLGLAESVRRFHVGTSPVRAAGVLCVRYGDRLWARVLARAAGLPPSGRAVPLQLTITPTARGERWRRTFVGRWLTSFVRHTASGLLAERFGLLEMWFRLEVNGTALVYRPAGGALRLGPLCLPLPHALVPFGHASERPEGGRLRIAVEVGWPFVGRLITYEGSFQAEQRP